MRTRAWRTLETSTAVCGDRTHRDHYLSIPHARCVHTMPLTRPSTPVPPHARLGPETTSRYFERYGAILVTRNRLFLLTGLQAIALIGFAWALVASPPTIRYRAYVVVAHPSGRTTVIPARPAHHITAVVLRYFLARWATRLLILNRGLTKRDLMRDYRLTRGAAVREFRSWVVGVNPLKRLHRHPNLTRSVTVRALSLLPHHVAIIRLRTTTWGNGHRIPRRTGWLLTLNYALAHPRHRRTLLIDPLGLYVTNFTLAKAY